MKGIVKLIGPTLFVGALLVAAPAWAQTGGQGYPPPVGQEDCPTPSARPPTRMQPPAAPTERPPAEITPPQEPGFVAEPPPAAEEAPTVRREERATRLEAEVQVGFGDFTGGLGAATSIGPTYAARLGMTFARIVSLGLGYRGSANAASAGTGFLNDAVQTNGIDLTLRIAPIAFWGISPYAVTGLGAVHVAAGSRGPATSEFDNGWAGATPLGGGLQITPTSWLGINLEATYVFLWAEDFQPVGMAANNNTNQWNVAASLRLFL